MRETGGAYGSPTPTHFVAWVAFTWPSSSVARWKTNPSFVSQEIPRHMRACISQFGNRPYELKDLLRASLVRGVTPGLAFYRVFLSSGNQCVEFGIGCEVAQPGSQTISLAVQFNKEQESALCI